MYITLNFIKHFLPSIVWTLTSGTDQLVENNTEGPKVWKVHYRSNNTHQRNAEAEKLHQQEIQKGYCFGNGYMPSGHQKFEGRTL